MCQRIHLTMIYLVAAERQMAENEPTEVHPKVEPATQDPIGAPIPSEEPRAGSPNDQSSTDVSPNTSHAQEPKENASASDPSAASTGAPAVDTPGMSFSLNPAVYMAEYKWM
jgi:hypothetical protein